MTNYILTLFIIFSVYVYKHASTSTHVHIKYDRFFQHFDSVVHLVGVFHMFLKLFHRSTLDFG